jgi:hypothetical protein
VNSSTGWLSGKFGSIFKTTNGGDSWNLQASLGTTYVFNSMDFLNESTGWAVGDPGGIFVTTNSGINWNLQQGGGIDTLVGIDMVNSSTGYMAGFGGVILKTTNGGYVGVETISNEIPQNFSLSQNYPNPFNPATNIEFDIAKSSYVKLAVYDLLGKEISVPVNEYLSAGKYKISFDAVKLPSGTYIYKITTDKFAETRKMILIK